MVLPFVSCGARFAVYAMLIPAFFERRWQAPVLMSLYLLGTLLAVGGARLLRGTLLRGESMPFVMELPPYRMPTLWGCILHTWRRGREYVVKAGTIVLAFSVVMWFLSAFPRHGHPAARPDAPVAESADPHSYADRIGHAMEPLLRPMGFDARIGTALIGSIAGKELLISQLGVAFSLGETDPTAPGEAADRESGNLPLQRLLRQRYSPLVGFCLLLFSMLSAPCLATFAVTWRESGHIRWALLQTAGLTVAAFLITTLVFQVGRLLGY
jgi:ferrous iron transport protein B